MSDRTSDYGEMTHFQEIGCLTKLMLDLKKQKLGYTFDEISEERLEECSKAIHNIMQCRKKGLFK